MADIIRACKGLQDLDTFFHRCVFIDIDETHVAVVAEQRSLVLKIQESINNYEL